MGHDKYLGGDVEKEGASVAPAIAEDHHASLCLNCQSHLIGPHCHICGQEAHLHRSLLGIGHDFLHGVAHFEGSFWNSLPMLLWHPGELTRRYIAGERTRFMSPFALFLLAVFLTYAVFSLAGSGTQVETIDDGASRTISSNRPPEVLSGAAPSTIDQPASPSSARERLNLRLDSGNEAIDNLFERAQENPQLIFYKVQANAYKFAWALIPLSLAFLWLIFPFNRRLHLYDHFIFVTFSISFVLILFVIARLLALTPLGGAALSIAVCFLPVHMFRQLRGAYGLGNGAALWRTIYLLIVSLLIAVFFLVGLMAIGAASL